MLAAFPYPLPDELLYSVCARYAHRVQYPHQKTVMGELFGGKTFHAVVDFPGYLDELVRALPPERGFTVDRIIDEHTLFPAYAPFQPFDRVQRAREAMAGLGQARACVYMGLWGCGVSSPKSLRYCPCCISEDRELYGEAYWHRLHQIAGVEVCPRHGVFLENSDVRIDGPSFRRRLFTADTATGSAAPLRSLDSSNPHHEVLAYIATQLERLLAHPGLCAGSEELHWRYRQLLQDRSLVSCTEKILGRKLYAAFLDYYGAGLLEKLQSAFDPNRNSNWLLNLLRHRKHSAHPVRHLLLVRFLDHTVDSLLHLQKGPEPFGEGPWPCLNRTAKHYRQDVVSECKIVCRRWERRKPLGIFTCECGFQYSRPGPDACDGDR